MAPAAEPNSQELLIKQLPRYKSSDVRERNDLNMRSGLVAAPWVEEFLQAPVNEKVLTCGALLSDATELPQDHMVSVMEASQLQSLMRLWEVSNPRDFWLASC
eukprot:jgi/Astpho2/9909/fgenesh1_pg.00152_%23_27_t